LRHLLKKAIFLIYFSQVYVLVSCGDNEDNKIEDTQKNEVKTDSSAVNKTPDTVSVSEIKVLMEQPGIIVLDVRASGDYDKNSIDNTLNLDYNSDQFEENITFLDKEMTYLVLSDSDEKSGNAVAKLKSKGYNSSLIMNGADALK
jgi:rhodanese-related sulfurtransferase